MYINVLGQLCVLQSWFSPSAPTQSAPPYCGTGFVHVLDLFCDIFFLWSSLYLLVLIFKSLNLVSSLPQNISILFSFKVVWYFVLFLRSKFNVKSNLLYALFIYFYSSFVNNNLLISSWRWLEWLDKMGNMFCDLRGIRMIKEKIYQLEWPHVSIYFIMSNSNGSLISFLINQTF
jgi:hypothetical protein